MFSHLLKPVLLYLVTRYNQNFSGLYCECHRPYPDPEDPVSTDCMVQVKPSR